MLSLLPVLTVFKNLDKKYIQLSRMDQFIVEQDLPHLGWHIWVQRERHDLNLGSCNLWFNALSKSYFPRPYVLLKFTWAKSISTSETWRKEVKRELSIRIRTNSRLGFYHFWDWLSWRLLGHIWLIWEKKKKACLVKWFIA